jgi:hypothetical protein
MEQKKMNMISTGEFTEMDASNKQDTLVSKLVSAWEKKNSKTARAGGASLMALSLAACGSGSDESSVTQAIMDSAVAAAKAAAEAKAATEASAAAEAAAAATALAKEEAATAQASAVAAAKAEAEAAAAVVEAATPSTFDLTPLNDIAATTTAVNGSIASNFRFSTGNEIVNAISASIATGDTLLDPVTTDGDVINITSTAAMNAMTAVNIETANINMAAGSPTGVFTNFTGLTTVNVSGSVAGTITNAGTATINTDDYTRVLTVQADLSGTTALSTANSMSVGVSGATFGSTVATRSTIIVDNTDAGTDGLETLNVASNGSAANVFYLDASADTTFGTINVTGSAGATIRLDHADVTGLTIAAGTNTGDVDLSIDRNGATTTMTNLLNMSGAESITVRDSTAGGDTANVSGVSSGQKLVLSSDFTGADIDLAGVARTAPAASLTVVLDNGTAATDTDIAGNLDIQDVTALAFESNGNATSSTAATAENGFTLVGDATTVTITGDTSVDVDLTIDAAGATGASARAVTVDASGLTGTARAELNATASSLVSYNMTGTGNADELIANAAGSTLTGGGGADTLTGGAGADTINGGLGIDTVDGNAGTNSVTLGGGADLVTIGDIDVTAVAQKTTHTISATWAAADTIATTIGTKSATYTVSINDMLGTNAAADLANIEASYVNWFNSTFMNDGVTAANSAGTAFAITATTTVDATPTVTIAETTAGTGAIADATTTAGVDAVAVATTVTDFDTAATGDVIQFDISDLAGQTAITAMTDGDDVDSAAAEVVVLLNYTIGTAFSDTDGTADGQNVVKASYSSTINSAANFDAAYDANTITVDGTLDDGDALAAVFYDADDSQAVVGFIIQANSDGAVIDNDATFNEVARLTMTQTEYAALDAGDFSFIA